VKTVEVASKTIEVGRKTSMVKEAKPQGLQPARFFFNLAGCKNNDLQHKPTYCQVRCVLANIK